MHKLISGQMTLVFCCLFYLLWWRAGYYPGSTVSKVTGKVGALLYITIALGVIGVILSVSGIRSIPVERNILPAGRVILGGCILYLLLLLGTSLLLHRQVTTELVLITAWTVLMVCAIQKVYSASFFSRGDFTVMLLVTAAAAILSLVFYLAYYNVEPLRAWVYGMIPLITEAFTMGLFAALLIKAGR